MPVIVATGNFSPGSFGVRTPGMGTASLSAAQAGSGPAANVLDRGGSSGPVLLRLVTTIGATPTCTYAVEGSPDNVNFFPVQYADSGSPQTLVITTFVITTAVTALKLIPALIPVRFLRVT